MNFSSFIAQKSTDSLLERNPDYYAQFRDTVSEAFFVPYTPRKAESVSINFDESEELYSYGETKGDTCFGQLMGTVPVEGSRYEYF